MLFDLDKQKFYERFSQLEKEYIQNENGETVNIKAYCSQKLQNTQNLMVSTDALTPVLKTALVINWKTVAMQKRIKRFQNLYPEIDSLEKMQNLLNTMDALLFCKRYLDINVNPAKPDKNPKYVLLKNLVNGFLDYKDAFKLSSEIQALRHWADNLNPKSDFIGRLNGVGPGVVENIRLNLGYHVIKPDRHVFGVLEKEFGLNWIEYTDFLILAKELEINAFYLDRVLFEYGRKLHISSTRVNCN